MSNILLIGFTNLFQMPYLKNFSNLIEQQNITYDIVYWNRFGIDENNNLKTNNTFIFNHSLDDDSNGLLKIKGFLLFRNKLIKVINNANYSKIIVLTSLPSFLIYKLLIKNFNNRFIFDIRDYSYENFGVFKYFLNNIIKSSSFTTISSKGFKSFLPESDKYVLSTNLKINNSLDNKFFSNKLLNFNSNKVTIIYIGAISYLEMNLKFLKLFGNNNNFNLIYVGHGPAKEKIKEYCHMNKYSNVSFHGRFMPSEKLKYYKKAEIIFNLYGNDSTLTKYAISNKLYDSVNNYMPILVCKNTYMEKESINGNFGYVVDLENINTPDNLYNWFLNLDKKKFINNCDTYLQKTVNENINFERNVINFLRKP